MTEFNFHKLREIYDQEKLQAYKDEVSNPKYKKTKDYVSKYFIPSTTGTHILIENKDAHIIQNETMKQVYLSRFADVIAKWYIKETIPRRIICDLHKPLLTDTEVNISPKLKHEYVKYETFDNDTKVKVNIFLDYVKTIWANNNNNVYTYLLKWIAQMCRGNKNKSCLYAKGPEGIGKSTLVDILYDYVIGSNLCCKGKADHLKGQHNMQLLGKIFVPFEELQFFNDKEWNAIDSEIKDLITGDYASYTDKYEKRFDAKNTNNYIINSNFNAIKGANGRRYVVLDINTQYQNNTAYFKKIRDNCYNNKVGHAIYCYLYEIDTKKFNALEIPETQNKLDLVVELMTPVEKFLKETYILKQKGIKDKLKNVHELYVQFCTDKKINYQSIQAFSKTLREYGIIYRKSDGYNIYDVKFEYLDTLAKNKKWYHALDDDSNDSHSDDEDPLEYGIQLEKTKPISSLSISDKIKYHEEQLKELQKKFLEELDSKFKVDKVEPKANKKIKRIIPVNKKYEVKSKSSDDFFKVLESEW